MLVALVLAELALSGGWHPALVIYPLLGFGFLRLRAPRLRKQAQAAREANLKLAAELCLSAVSVKMPGRALFRPGGLVRRRLMRSHAVAMVVLVALGVTATIWALGQNHRWAGRANLVCAREHARLTALPALRLGPIATLTRTNVIEQEALTGLRATRPAEPAAEAVRRLEGVRAQARRVGARSARGGRFCKRCARSRTHQVGS